jgi:excinuclease ABC subunit C
MFLDGRTDELERKLTKRMEAAAEEMQFEAAARLRDQIVTVHQMQDKQRIATAENEDADVFGFHYENDMIAVNLFHMRGGKIVDRRDFFWEDLPEFLESSLNDGFTTDAGDVEPDPNVKAPELGEGVAEVQTGSLSGMGGTFSPGAFFSALLKQLYLDQPYVPRSIYVPVDFEDRALLAELLSERTKHRIELAAPQRGEKRSLVDLVCQNAKQSYDQRFRVLAPSQKAIQEALQDALMLEELPKRIECFDISHIQGAETVASMVVWEDGAMKKSDYRKFQIKTVAGNDDFASMREVIQRRYKRLLEEKKPFPSLVLIDGGLGQLGAAYAALEEIGVTLQPLASIAKKEEIIYVHGQEDEPVVLDRRSPVLHLVQKIRDESHRFAVTYHRKRRQMRDKVSELDAIPGVGPRTRQRLVEHFGSVRGIKQASPDALRAVVNQATAEKIRRHFAEELVVIS